MFGAHHAAQATAAAPTAAAAASARASGLAMGCAAPVESVLKMATELAEAREEREAATALASYIRPDDAAAGIGVGLNVGVKSSRSARASRAGHAQMITPAAV